MPASNKAPLNGPIDARPSATSPRSRVRPSSASRRPHGTRGRELTEFFGGKRRFAATLLRHTAGTAPRRLRSAAASRATTTRPHQEGAGTGFIIDKSGFILTNNHVVEGANDIRISLFGGGRTESYAAKVIGRLVDTNVALIQLTEMPVDAAAGRAAFGDSAQTQPGDWVVAIGNPFDFQPHRHRA